MIRALYLGPADLLPHVQKELGDRFAVNLALDAAEADRHLPTTEVLLDAFMRVRFDSARLARASQLRLVVTATTGADHIDSDHLASRDVPLWTLKGQTEVLRQLTPAAEHSWLLLMACARKLRGAVDEVLAGGWNRNNHPGIMLRGKTLGIVGCGRIGQRMAEYAHAFGMRAIGFDPLVSPWPASIERVELPELCAQADFVTIHVSLSPETRGLIGPQEVERMKRDVVFINTSRGEIVDEGALARAIEAGHIGAAGLDVLTGEPEVGEHPLVGLARRNSNVVITPHIGGFSPDAVRVVLSFSCARIHSFFGTAR